MTGNNDSASPGAQDPRLEDQDIAGIPGNPIPHLDGNAAAGALWEVFRIDIIAAMARCWAGVVWSPIMSSSSSG